MKNWIFESTDFLLFSHNCVVIPDFGAFIIGVEVAAYNENGLCAPAAYVTFNQEVRHNDGILATYCQNRENISYDSACKKIKDTVVRIKSELKQGNKIPCGKIGHLCLNENQSVSFEPNLEYIHPNYIGLQRVCLDPLRFIEEENQPQKRKKYVGYIAAAVAASLFFVAPSINIGEQSHRRNSQQADISLLLKKGFGLDENTLLKAEAPIEIENTVEDNIAVADDYTLAPQAQGTSQRTYYIIIGSETSQRRATILQHKFQKDFPEVEMLKSADRYRLSVASFDEKEVAEEYVLTFRDENPKYKNAWLLSQRNK